jgi:hypothetical protein
VAVLFLPLALATMVWPAVSHWCRRLADTLVALILSKLVIAAVLALAVGALAGGLGVGATGSDGGGFAAVVSGIALLIIATLSPFTLLRLIPAVEAGAVSHLESARHRLSSPVQQGGNLALDMARAKKRPDGAEAGAAETVGSASAAIPMVAGSAYLAEYFHGVGEAGAQLPTVTSRHADDDATGDTAAAEVTGRDGRAGEGRG